MGTNKGSVVSTLAAVAAFGLLVFAGMGLHRSLSVLHHLAMQQEQVCARLQDSVVRLDEAVARLEKKAALGGAESGAKSSEPATGKPASVEAYREALRERIRQHQKQDLEKYGEDLVELYAKAVPRGPTDSRESRQAFGLLIERYPDSYAAGMAIAEHGLRAAMAHSAPEVETFRNMLLRKEQFKQTVTDREVEAIPALSAYLATHYAADGRKDDAVNILDALAEGFGSSYVAIGGVGGRPKFIPVAEFVESVKGDIESGRSRPPTGPGGPGPGGPGGPGPGGPPPRRN